MLEGKKVSYTLYDHLADHGRSTVKAGRFVGWGISYTECANGFGHYTTALVLTNDGRIESVDLEHIQFADPQLVSL